MRLEWEGLELFLPRLKRYLRIRWAEQRGSGCNAAIEHGPIDGVNGTVWSDDGWGVGLARRLGQGYAVAQRVGREIPSVDATVLAIHYGALVDGVDGGGVDAPLAD